MVRSAIVALSTLLLLSSPALATTHVVDVNGTGSHLAIGPAITAASSGDTILVLAGTYSGEDNRNMDFGTKNLVVKSQSGHVQTIIYPEYIGACFILSDAGIDTSTVIRGFTLRGGFAMGGADDGGAGVSCTFASPIIEMCTFDANHGSNGGGVRLFQSSAIVRYCRFEFNQAYLGGGIYTNSNAPTIRNCSFWANAAATDGGAIACYEGTPSIWGCTVAGNQGGSRGSGGIRLGGLSIDATVERCVVAHSFTGDGISGDTANGTVEHCIVYNNVGGDDLPDYAGDNLFVNPLFCGWGHGDMFVCEDSPVLPDHNDWGEHIGWYGSDCPPCETPVEDATWGSIKALYR